MFLEARNTAIGVHKSDETIDYMLALEILSLIERNEYLEDARLSFAVENLREDLRKTLGLGFMDSKLLLTDN